MSVRQHLGSLPTDLAKALDSGYAAIIDHFLKEEWDDAEVDAGRFCEATLRYLQWRMNGTYTAIDGKSKPNRKKVVGDAAKDTNLPPTLRSQLPQIVELTMDFRNNRNSAHLGDIEANQMDATCVVQNVTWVIGEIVRIESNKDAGEVQTLLDQLAERHVPLIQKVGDRPVVLDPDMTAANKALVLLYAHDEPVPIATLREWAEYGHSTKWRKNVLGGLAKDKLLHVDGDGIVHLLRPGEAEAQKVLLAAGSSVT